VNGLSITRISALLGFEHLDGVANQHNMAGREVCDPVRAGSPAQVTAVTMKGSP
jgi:hypothetical protein